MTYISGKKASIRSEFFFVTSANLMDRYYGVKQYKNAVSGKSH